MRIYTKLESIDELKGSSITIGNFDGVHLGHHFLLGQIKHLADSGSSKSWGVITFHPHPKQLLCPDAKFTYLQTRLDMIQELEALGAGFVFLLPFTQEIALMSPDNFLSAYIINPFLPKNIVVGEDFVFGKNREGGIAFLRDQESKYSYDLLVVKKRQLLGSEVSSSRIKKLLAHAKLSEVSQLLGRDYSLTGVVEKGAERGRQIGFPTANLKLKIPLSLSSGVYITTLLVDGKSFSSMTNVGFNPTFNSVREYKYLKVETHILNENINLYGKTVKITFFKKIREEIKFSGPKQLTEQLLKDKACSERYFREHVEMG